MPELPEAERARAALERHALGLVVADADDSDSYVCRPWPPGAIREATERTFLHPGSSRSMDFYWSILLSHRPTRPL